MRKFINLSLILLLFYAFIFNLNGGEVDKKLHQDCLYPTVLVGKADNSGFGSGVIVRSEKVGNVYRNVFITCAHLIDDTVVDYEVRQYIYEDWSQVKEVRSFPAMFFAYNRNMDIAIGVFLSTEEMPIAKLDFDPKIFIGNEVYRIGCGLGGEPRLDYGKLTSNIRGQKPWFRTSVMTVPGDSGSPLFHEYKVIGIMVSIYTLRNLPVFQISSAVSLDRFRQWDNANNKNLSFAWDIKKPLPEFVFRYLKFKNP